MELKGFKVGKKKLKFVIKCLPCPNNFETVTSDESDSEMYKKKGRENRSCEERKLLFLTVRCANL